MVHNKCGMCEFLQLKLPNNKSGLATEGYCYGVPPAPGKFYPKMNVSDRGCGCFKKKIPKENRE